jgi:hypothetical protein
LKDDFPYNLLFLGLCCLYGLVVGLFIMKNEILGVLAAILPLLAWFTLIDARNCLYLLLAFLPFQASPFIYQNLMGIPGAKPFSLLAILALVVCFYHGGQLIYQPHKTRRKAIIYLAMYFTFFSLALFRSLGYLKFLHALDPEKFESSNIKYLLSYYIKPSLLLVSFIYILNHITSKKDIEKIFTFLCVVLGLISFVVVIISLSHGTIFMQHRDATNQFWNSYLGFHYNHIGSFYVVLGPLIIVPAIKKRFWGMLNYFLAMVSLILLQGRTSLLIFPIGSLLMLFLLGKKKELIILLAIFLLFSLNYLPGFIINSLQDIGRGDWNQVFTGRIDSLWLPLLSEWKNNIWLLLLGRGKYAMMTSSGFQIGTVLDVTHPHNAFIEFFLDNGIILLLVFIFFIIKLTKLAWHKLRLINSDIGWALFVSIICYLIATFTGRSLYPSYDNMFLFPVIALLVNHCRLPKSILVQTDPIASEVSNYQ